VLADACPSYFNGLFGSKPLQFCRVAKRHYYSSILKFVTTILLLLDSCHFLRLINVRTHCQTVFVHTIFVSFPLHSLTCGPNASSSSSTSRWLPNSGTNPALRMPPVAKQLSRAPGEGAAAAGGGSTPLFSSPLRRPPGPPRTRRRPPPQREASCHKVRCRTAHRCPYLLGFCCCRGDGVARAPPLTREPLTALRRGRGRVLGPPPPRAPPPARRGYEPPPGNGDALPRREDAVLLRPLAADSSQNWSNRHGARG
jgi:hypothetical protein